MPDWAKSMQQTFEYFIVDPVSWKESKQLMDVTSCTIERDSEADTLGSATFDIVNSVGEAYIRAYLVTIQDGIKERFALGTFLVQTPSSNFDGKIKNISMDAYTPLLELKENPPPLGYYVPKEIKQTIIVDGANSVSTISQKAMDWAYNLTKEHLRAPVVKPESTKVLFNNFVADTSDTWLSFIKDLASYAKFNFDVDEMGRILFAPIQDTASLQPIWTYDVDNESILYPEITTDHDLYGIPNVVEVIYSDSTNYFYSRIVNDDPNSPTSTINRGREIIYRETSPSVIGDPTNNQIKDYATQLLRNLSTLSYKISYTHAYCPVRVGDCVRINYPSAGLKNVKAKIISQSISCTPGCPVREKAIFTEKFWG